MSSATARKSVLRRFSSSISDLLNIQKRVEDEKETLLHNAILMGNMTNLKQLIQNSICDVDQEDEKGHTALHVAMEQHGTEAASILLANGASPDATDFHGVTPAHLACAAGNIDTFDLLLYYKADVCAVDKAGRSPLDSASEQGRLMMVEKILESGLPIDVLKKSSDSHTASALHLAARMGHVQVVSALLQFGWDIGRVTDKGTPLHEAATHGRTQVVRLLLHMGIDSTVLNSRGMSAYDCAKKSSSRNPISSKEIRSLLKNQHTFSYAEAIIDYNGEAADELTLSRGDVLWVIDKGNTEEVRYRGVIFGEKGNSRCGYFDRKAVRAIERPSSVISVPSNRFSGMPLHSTSGVPRAPMKVDVPLPPNMKGHASTSQLPHHREENMIRQNSSPLPALSQNNTVMSRPMSRQSDGRAMSDANGNRIRPPAPQYPYNHSNIRMSTFKSGGMTSSMAPISLSSPIEHSHYGGTVNSPRDSTGSNSSGFESLKGVSGHNSASPSHASFRSATTALVESPQSRISMNSSHSNESSGPSSHSSCSVDTLDDAALPLDVTSMVQKGINEGEILALWFERLGHTEYLSLFLTQGYDLASIARITPEDLTTLGIKNPQHRMKLMAEIHSWNLTDSWPDSVPPGGLREWLCLMGMPEYADTFESQGYDSVEKINRLCWEDFEDIGVKRLGHLKRLQLALKKLKNRNMNEQKARSVSVFSTTSPFSNPTQMYSRCDPPPPAPVSILKKPSSAMSEIDYFSYTRNGATSHYSDPLFAERRRQPLNLNLTATSKILSDRSVIEQPPNSSYTGSGVDCPPPPAPLSYESTRRLKDPSWNSTHSSTSTLHAQPLFADADDTGTIRARQKAKPLPPEHLISRIGLGSTFFQDPILSNDELDEDPLGDVSNMLENLMHDLEAHTKPANRRSTECPGSFPT